MALMEWSDELDIHVDGMNDQHKIILKYMNTLYDHATTNNSFESNAETITELAEYTVKHFKEEEEFMESINYNGLESHKVIHQDLLKKFTKHVERMKAAGEVDQSFFSFLKLWLSAHIKGLDMKYGHAANAENVA